MKPIEALQILDQATAQFNGNRQQHFQIQEALRTIKILVDANEDKKEIVHQENPQS